MILLFLALGRISAALQAAYILPGRLFVEVSFTTALKWEGIQGGKCPVSMAGALLGLVSWRRDGLALGRDAGVIYSWAALTRLGW